jgi:hypothetical protein
MMSLFLLGAALRKHQHGADESVFDDERLHEQLREAREQQRVHVTMLPMAAWRQALP